MSFTVHEHTPTSAILQKALKASLPYSLNLVYRIQHTNRTEHAHILSTIPENATTIPDHWAAAYYDRSMRPETELWIYAQGEVPGHSSPPSPSSTSSTDSSFCPECRCAILELVKYIGSLPTPPLHAEALPALDLARAYQQKQREAGPKPSLDASAGSYVRHLLLDSVVTLGACHHQIVDILSKAGLVREDLPGPDSELNKFLFKMQDLPTTRDLPEGLRWGEMREKDIAIVQARTNIPRQKRTLMSLKSVGVFEEKMGRAISWTFLGLDGSLTTLHTEPEYRGKGIAKAVAAKMLRENAPTIAVDEQRTAWAHADVYIGNDQSESVCRSLGGYAAWKIYWVRIDFTKADAI